MQSASHCCLPCVFVLPMESPCVCQGVVYAVGGQGNHGRAVHPTIERLDGERFVLLPQQMKAERKYVSASAFAGDTGLTVRAGPLKQVHGNKCSCLRDTNRRCDLQVGCT